MVDSESPSPPDPRIGNVLQGRYRILSKIAAGAMGVVYRGERVQLSRPVAVKFLHPWIAAQKAFLTRFENEARAMSRLIHPHCVSVMDFGVEGAPYLVMDFVTGRTLRDHMLVGRLPVARVVHVTQQLLAGLAHAHAQGIVHRDLKPENLMLSDEAGMEEHLRILDFGLAKLRDGPAMTAGMAVGTPSYMSPEQSGAEGEIDARTDLYAVGILMFEMLAGRKPFQSENVGELILMQREAPVPALRAVAPAAGYSAALEAVVSKAMAKLAADRFQSAAELSAAIDATPEGGGTGRPVDAGGAARPAPRPAGATTVDTVSAVRRRLAADEGTGAAAPPQPVRQWRLTLFGAGVVLLAMLGLLVGRGLKRSGESSASPAASPEARPAVPVSRPVARPPVPVTAAPPPTTVAAQAPTAVVASRSAPSGSPALEQARQLIASGQVDQAIALLGRLRASEPENAEVVYLQAMVYLDGHRWPEGIAAAQLAVRNDPGLKTDPDLIKGAIRSLVSDHGYERSEVFLRSLGEPALPFIRDAARHDGSPKVRQRAAELLGGGSGGSARGWPARASGASVFKR